MFPNTQQDDMDAHDLHALALSTSQIRACILGCNELFSKRMDSHSLEVTRLTRDASHIPSTRRFTSSLQLSTYFNNDASDAGEERSGLEI